MTTDAHSEPTPEDNRQDNAGFCDHSITEDMQYVGGRIERVCIRCGKTVSLGIRHELGGGRYQVSRYGW